MDGSILINITMNAIIPFFGSGSKKRNDEADLIYVIYKRFSIIIQLNLNILYQTLGILRVTIKRVYPKSLGPFGLVS